MSNETPVQPDASTTSSELAAASPRGSGPFWYLAEGVRIARFDETAIRRAADDRRSLFYGMSFVAVGTVATQVVAFFQTSPAGAPDASLGNAFLAAIIFVPVQLLVSACSIGLMHGAAQLMFGASGRYIALLRALWLAAIVGWLGVIPVLGPLVASLWSLVISLVVFEEVDGIERLQALLLVVALGALTFVVTAFVMAALR